ncbi:hypothetical protein ACFPOD_05225 [Nitratireductor kimnyeongensis]|uniref:Uncharacterized protein n=1 Tax=Nitratireductor kimnyeongensis TaxID=430679 RepID=A0ABW0T5P1_9HYPH|nr:hypothetical protein [Nitratireductor kimnyeongensis]QZZ34518.1 hypothetical protein KW403_11975 [Nitratireductor kimnyeongensis]
MGVLVDEKFWTMATNRMWLSFPPPDRPISNQELAEILEIGCRTFSEVLSDPDYARDLEEVIALRDTVDTDAPGWLEDFRGFFERFAQRERALLVQSQMDEQAAVTLLAALREIVTHAAEVERWIAETEDLNRLFQVSREICCGYAERARNEAVHASPEERRKLLHDALELVGAGAMIAINTAAWEATSVIGGSLMIIGVVRRRF